MLLAMIGSIGLQFYTNSKNNAKVREIQESQKEYQKAAQLKQFERMRQLQADQAKLAMELEKQIHKERIEEIEKEYDEVLDHLIDDFALQSWPLNVLPFIMRGESYGSLVRGGSKTIAIHCILTPSNCNNFNKQVFQELDFRLEAEMNNHWNCQTTHPIVYYGGAWKKNNSCEDDLLTDILLLRTELRSIPCLIITPHFDSNGLTFVINLWGMGENKAAYTITPPDNYLSYSETYKKALDFGFTEEFGYDLYNTTIEELVPYIESLIGFIADKYFWSMYNVEPILPHILLDMQHDINSFKSLKDEAVEQYKAISCSVNHIYRSSGKEAKFLSGYSCLLDKIELEKEYNKIIISYYNEKIGKKMRSLKECFEGVNTDKYDIPFLINSYETFLSDDVKDKIQKCIEDIDNKKDIPLLYCANNNELYQRIFNLSKDYNKGIDKFICKRTNEYYCIGCFVDSENKILYSMCGDSFYIFSMRGYRVCSLATKLTNLKFYEEETTIEFPLLEEEPLMRFLCLKEKWLSKLIMVDQKISSYLPIYLFNAPLINIKYDDLKDWADRNRNHNSSFNIIVGYSVENSMYYIIGMFDSDEKNIFACYCNTIDDSINKRILNKTTIKIKL